MPESDWSSTSSSSSSFSFFLSSFSFLLSARVYLFKAESEELRNLFVTSIKNHLSTLFDPDTWRLKQEALPVS